MIRKSLIFVGISCSLSMTAQDELIKKVIGNASVNSKFEFKEVINLETTSVNTRLCRNLLELFRKFFFRI